MRRRGYTCKQLAYAEVKKVVNVLIRWQALNSTQEAATLLKEMGLEESSLSLADALRPSAWLPQRPQELAIPFQPGTLYGRQEELAWLKQAVFEQKARLVGITGLGGIGKSALAASFIHANKDHFEVVVWYSLWNAPPLHTTLTYFLNRLRGAGEPQARPATAARASEAIHQQLGQLLECLQQTRCLLILDNFETVLASGQADGTYLEGYTGYGHLLVFSQGSYAKLTSGKLAASSDVLWRS